MKYGKCRLSNLWKGHEPTRGMAGLFMRGEIYQGCNQPSCLWLCEKDSLSNVQERHGDHNEQQTTECMNKFLKEVTSEKA